MSSLIFYTDPDQAFVVTDTLAVTKTVDGSCSPLLFTSKALYLPHLRLIVAGTGLGSLCDRWFSAINTKMVVEGIEHLNEFSQACIQQLWEDLLSEADKNSGCTSTIYHFGVSESTGDITSYAYRSTNDFAPEPLTYGTACKPGVAIPEGNLIEHLPAIMSLQREAESVAPPSERVHIGGQAISIHLTKNGCHHRHQFDFHDFDFHAEQAFARTAPSLRLPGEA